MTKPVFESKLFVKLVIVLPQRCFIQKNCKKSCLTKTTEKNKTLEHIIGQVLHQFALKVMELCLPLLEQSQIGEPNQKHDENMKAKQGTRGQRIVNVLQGDG